MGDIHRIVATGVRPGRLADGQFDARIQAYGIFPPGAEMFVARYHSDGDLVGVLGWNMPRELRAERAVLAAA